MNDLQKLALDRILIINNSIRTSYPNRPFNGGEPLTKEQNEAAWLKVEKEGQEKSLELTGKKMEIERWVKALLSS